MEQEITTAENAHLTFNLGKETYSVAVDSVNEIIEMTEVTLVPESPYYMRGIINLKGNILPVIDTRVKLGLEASEETKKTRIIVFDIKSQDKKIKVGAIVDRAREVIAVNNEEIKPPPNVDDYQRAIYIEGILNYDDQFIMILDVNKLFARGEVEEIENINI